MSLGQVAAFLNGASTFNLNSNGAQVNLPPSTREGQSIPLRTGFRLVSSQPTIDMTQTQSSQSPFSYDIIEDEAKIRILIDLPGVSADNISFTFTEDGDPSLTIERSSDYPQNQNNIIGRRFGRYVITWPIHTRVRLLTHPHWSLVDGVLTLEFQKRDDIRGVEFNISTLPIIAPVQEVPRSAEMEQVHGERSINVPELGEE